MGSFNTRHWDILLLNHQLFHRRYQLALRTQQKNLQFWHIHLVNNAPGHLSRASVLLCAAEFWKQSCRILLFASFWIFPFLNFSLISVIRWLFSSLDFDEIIWINPFQANAPILYLLQTPENLWFSGVFTGYKMWTLAWNGLIPNFAHFHQHHKLWIF